jgi:hypothetical protein
MIYGFVSVTTAMDSPVIQQLKRVNSVLRRKLSRALKLKQRAEGNLSRFRKSISKMLNPDQLEALHRRSTRGLKWSTTTVKKALRLRFTCGARGYTELRTSTGYPLPGITTLQQKLQHINFHPGVLHTVFSYLATKVLNILL